MTTVVSYPVHMAYGQRIMKAPLAVQSNTPPELVQQLFAKLGAKYVIVTDANGYCTLSLLTIEM